MSPPNTDSPHFDKGLLEPLILSGATNQVPVFPQAVNFHETCTILTNFVETGSKVVRGTRRDEMIRT